jgi:hypothetical protein
LSFLLLSLYWYFGKARSETLKAETAITAISLLRIAIGIEEEIFPFRRSEEN